MVNEMLRIAVEDLKAGNEVLRPRNVILRTVVEVLRPLNVILRTEVEVLRFFRFQLLGNKLYRQIPDSNLNRL